MGKDRSCQMRCRRGGRELQQGCTCGEALRCCRPVRSPEEWMRLCRPSDAPAQRQDFVRSWDGIPAVLNVSHKDTPACKTTSKGRAFSH